MNRSSQRVGSSADLQKQVYEVRSPCPDEYAVPEVFGLAPRVDALQGKKIGLLSNGKINADVVLSHIGELLKARFGEIEIIKWFPAKPDPFSTRVDPETIFADVKPDVAIYASGD